MLQAKAGKTNYELIVGAKMTKNIKTIYHVGQKLLVGCMASSDIDRAL